MKTNLLRILVAGCGIILTATAIAKLVSIGGTAAILGEPDPVTTLAYRGELAAAAVAELAVAAICLSRRSLLLQGTALSWLGTMFVLYRIGLRWLDYPKPCPCLGNVTDALQIPPAVADGIMTGCVVYIVATGYGVMLSAIRARSAVPT